jgi:hypothetical protein
MRVAFEDVDGADGVGAEEAEGQEAQTEEEDGPVVFADVFAGETEDDGSDKGADGGEGEVEELVFGDALAAGFGREIGGPVAEESGQESDEDGGDEDGDEAKTDFVEGPSVVVGQWSDGLEGKGWG